MFGLTKREQRWKAEQQAAETVCNFAASLVRSVADASIAQANAETERLRKENAELRAAADAQDALAAHAIEELHQLGYTVRDGQLIPPDNLGELARVAGASIGVASASTASAEGAQTRNPTERTSHE